MDTSVAAGVGTSGSRATWNCKYLLLRTAVTKFVDLNSAPLWHITAMICILRGEDPSQLQWFWFSIGLSCHSRVWLWALNWHCAVAPSSSSLKDTYAAMFHSFEFIHVALMEVVQALVSYTKVKISSVQMKHRLSVPIFLQVPFSQGGLCFTDDKEDLATFATLFVFSHTINRYHLPPQSLVGGSPASFPPRNANRKAGIYIMCEKYW